MTRQKLFSEISYALGYIAYTEEKEKEVKKAFRKLKKDFKKIKPLEEENKKLKEENKKLKAAINILKKVGSTVNCLIFNMKFYKEQYKEDLPFEKAFYLCDFKDVTKEEYELLKEVLNG